MTNLVLGNLLIDLSNAYAKSQPDLQKSLQRLGRCFLKPSLPSLPKTIDAARVHVESVPDVGAFGRPVLRISEATRCLTDIMSEHGKATPAKSLKLLQAFLDDNQDKMLDSFLSRLEETLGKPVVLSIDDHIGRLRSALKDPKEFERAISTLKADKSIKKPQLAIIAEEISGFKQAGKVSDLYEAIASRHKAYISALGRQKASTGKSAA